RPPSTPPFPYTTLFRSLFCNQDVTGPDLPLQRLAVEETELLAVRFLERVDERKILHRRRADADLHARCGEGDGGGSVDGGDCVQDRKSTRLNSSHVKIS